MFMLSLVLVIYGLSLCFEQCLEVNPEEIVDREVDFVDIATDEVPEHKYKESEVSLYKCRIRCSIDTRTARATFYLMDWAIVN